MGPAGDCCLLGCFIVSVTRTHDVLKKARTNLEVRRPLHPPETPAQIQLHLSSESANITDPL